MALILLPSPFAWYDAKAGRFRMLTHTFRMGMVCGAGTSVPCGGSVPLGGGEPMGALASSGGAEPFENWTYHEDMLAYNWSVPVSEAVAGASPDSYTQRKQQKVEVMRRRERPFLFWDDDGKVYLFTSVSPADTKLQMYTHVQQVIMPPGIGGPLME